MSGFVTDENFYDPIWLSEKLSINVKSVSVESMSKAGGLAALMRRIRIITQSDEELTFVLKSSNSSGVATLSTSKQLGLPREAYFYNSLYGEFKDALPKVYFATGDMLSGQKYLLFEDLSECVQTGYFFGPGSPLNWGKDLEKETEAFPNISAEDIAESACKLAAHYHGVYWKKNSLRDYEWLRGSAWLGGDDEASWHGGQQYSKSLWGSIKSKIASDSYTVKWDPFMVDLMEASMSKISWDDFQQRIQSSSWTLVHGDFHPANMMWRKHPRLQQSGDNAANTTSSHLVLLDWEVVGVGSGAQDLGQYFISHFSPEARRLCEDRLLDTYYDHLLQCGVSPEEYSREACVREYVSGGVERWIFLLAVMASVPDPMMQYFHDQVLAFARDHMVTTDTVGMPRL